MLSRLTQVTVQAESGRAEFRRSGRVVELTIEARLPSTRADWSDSDLSEAIDASCEAEIQDWQRTVKELTDALLPQLKDQGDRPTITGQSDLKEHRTWQHEGACLGIDASIHRITSAADVDTAYSDAGVAQELIANLLASKAESIRNIYRTIRADIEKRIVGSETPGSRSSRH